MASARERQSIEPLVAKSDARSQHSDRLSAVGRRRHSLVRPEVTARAHGRFSACTSQIAATAPVPWRVTEEC